MIVWGTTGLTKTIDGGHFYCPQCEEVDVHYLEKSVRTWFTLYWIPISFVECEECGGQYKLDVLNVKPPTESERFMNKLFRSLEEGMSLNRAKEKLAEIGMDQKSAEGWIETFTKDDTWECAPCHEQFVGSVKRCPICKSKRPR
jgi:hypothetical protein